MYGYQYDALNRLVDAHYAKNVESSIIDVDSYNEHLGYDRNGNIQSLQRNGEFDDDTYYLQTDDLTYIYDDDNPNQLMKVDDESLNPNGFKDGVNTGDDYTYDANGNMIADANKDITGITYNHMNLPIQITFGTDKIEYLYDAAGTKLQKKVTWLPETIPATIWPETKTTDYLDGFQYVADKLQFFPTSEGYVKNTVVDDVNHFNYVYNYTDHLGNIRLSYGYDEGEAVLKVLEENNYYPFGLKHANYNMDKSDYEEKVEPGGIGIVSKVKLVYQYKYNGKEWQGELGLDLYDYGARNYDAAIGRWMNVDAHAESYLSMSPYTYAFNNPVLVIDPDGKDGIVTGSGTEDDPYIVTANYYYYGLTNNQEEGLNSAISHYNNKGQARAIKDAKGNDVFVIMNLSALKTSNKDEASEKAYADIIEMEDKNVFFGNIITSADGPVDKKGLGKSVGSKEIFIYQNKIDALLKSFPGGRLGDLIQGVFEHEIGHNLGGSHGDPGGLMDESQSDEIDKSSNTIGGGGIGKYKYVYPYLNAQSMRGFMGRVNSRGSISSTYLTQSENKKVEKAKDPGAPGTITKVN